MTQTDDDNPDASKPPYLAFPTFKTFLKTLESHVPNRIDKSIMRSVAGTVQAQLIPALKYLRLTDEAGVPTPALHSLAEAQADEGEWKGNLQRVVEAAYEPIIDGLNLVKATPQELKEKFVASGLSGSTLDKAVRFFLAAVKEAEMNVSPHLNVRARSSSGSRKSGRRSKDVGGDTGSPATPAPGESSDMMRQPIWDPSTGAVRGYVGLPKNYTQDDCNRAQATVDYLRQLLGK